jgi:hypothetical protein
MSTNAGRCRQCKNRDLNPNPFEYSYTGLIVFDSKD